MNKVINVDKNKYIFDKYSKFRSDKVSHKKDDDVLIFFIGNDETFSGHVKSIFYIKSSVDNGNKIHIFGIEKYSKLNSFVWDYIKSLNKKKRKLIKITFLDINLLKNIFDFKQKRAGLWGVENYFFTFNIWLIINKPYNNLHLFHTDVVLFKKLESSWLKENTLATPVGMIYIGRKDTEEERNFINNFCNILPGNFGLDLEMIEKYKKYHFHNTGLLSMGSKAVDYYSNWIKDNMSLLINNFKYTKFAEQEFLTIFSILTKYDLEIKNTSKFQSKISTNDVLFSHLDHGVKRQIMNLIAPDFVNDWSPILIKKISKIMVDIEKFIDCRNKKVDKNKFFFLLLWQKYWKNKL